MTQPGAPRGTYHLLLTLLIAFGTYLRLEGLGDAALFGDEHHSLTAATRPVGEILTSFDRFGSHVLTPLLQHLSLEVLGPEVWTLRLVSVLPGILSIVLLAGLAARVAGRGAALLAAGLLAASPMHVYYSRFGRPYALEVLAALLVVHTALVVLEEDRHLTRRRIALVAAVVLALYTHLSSAGFVGGVACAAVCCALWRHRTWAALGGSVGTFAVAGLITMLLYLPVLEPLRDYLGKERELDDRGPLSWLEVTGIMGGGALPGVLIPILALVGATVQLRRSKDAGALLAASVIGPLALLLLTRPFGMGYAYARYLIASLPFLLLLASIPLSGALGGREHRCGVLAIVLAAALHLTGPASILGSRTDFRNTYLAMYPLPALDRAWPQGSRFYEELAGDAASQRIIEVPLMRSRTALMLRAHQLVHNKEVLIGVGTRGLGPDLKGVRYVHLDRPGWRSRADWLVVHRAPDEELQRYLDFVYEGDFEGAERGLMQRNRRMRPNFPEAPELPQGLGAPDYQDQHVSAWRLGGR